MSNGAFRAFNYRNVGLWKDTVLIHAATLCDRLPRTQRTAFNQSTNSRVIAQMDGARGNHKPLLADHRRCSVSAALTCLLALLPASLSQRLIGDVCVRTATARRGSVFDFDLLAYLL